MNAPNVSGSPDSFQDRFAASLQVSGMTLSELARLLGEVGDSVSLTTLSYWRSGARQPRSASRTAVASIERLLRVRPGQLLERVPVEPPSARRAARRDDIFATLEIDHAISEMREQYGSSHDVMIDRINILTVELNATRDYARHRWSRVSQITGDDVSDFTVFFGLPRNRDETPNVISSAGARHVGTHFHPGREAFAFHFRFPYPMPRGAYVHVEYVIDAPLREPFAGLALSRRVREGVIHVVFHPDGIPDWAEVISGSPEDPRIRFISPLHSRSVVASVSGVGPGPFFVRWSDE